MHTTNTIDSRVHMVARPAVRALKQDRREYELRARRQVGRLPNQISNH